MRLSPFVADKKTSESAEQFKQRKEKDTQEFNEKFLEIKEDQLDLLWRIGRLMVFQCGILTYGEFI